MLTSYLFAWSNWPLVLASLLLNISESLVVQGLCAKHSTNLVGYLLRIWYFSTSCMYVANQKYYSCQLIHRKNKENLQNLSKRDRYTRTYTSLYINYHVNIHRDWQHETKEKAHTHMERCDSHTKRGSGQVAIFGMLCTKPRRGRRHGCLASVAPVNYFLHLWVRYLD
jgi:hypothetical protein